MGDYMFARFRWLEREISGFTFLKSTSRQTLQGAWWYNHDIAGIPDRPLQGSGNPVKWRRLTKVSAPTWAREFFNEVQRGAVRDYRS
jgi:hypothetical protein